MKRLQLLIAPAMLSFLLLSCAKDTDSLSDNYDLTHQTATAQFQNPNSNFDNSEKGIYHGIIASTTTQSRGKVWINVGNNGYYNAYIEMVDGAIYNLQLDSSSISEDDGDSTYLFTEQQGSFLLDLNNFNAPFVTNAVFNNQEYTVNVVKSRSTQRASAITATFNELNPVSDFIGTWSLISDGTIANPNGLNGEAITSVIITMEGSVYTDTVFDTFNGTNCFALPDVVPVLNSEGVLGHIVSAYQTSEFAMGIAKWGLGYDPVSSTYTNFLFCESATAGYFEWTNDEGTVTRIGEITVD
tara:strand:- start:13895 stop:14791 length:897 start_codon:yes stop_codon:yes gene_type:complete